MNQVLLLLIASLFVVQASAQSRPEEMKKAFLEQQCKPELRRMLANLAAALPSVPISDREEQICTCALDRIFQDKAISMIRDSDKQPPDPRLKAGDAKLQAYIFLKTTAAMHSCYASEFDSLARSMDPLK